jgi:hypothetical protein
MLAEETSEQENFPRKKEKPSMKSVLLVLLFLDHYDGVRVEYQNG